MLVTAPLDARVEVVRAKRGITEKKAKKLVKRMQRAREMFYKRYSAGKWMLHSGKDVVVNRARFGRQGCVDILAAAYRTKVAAVERAKQGYRVGLPRFLCLRGTWSFDWVPYVRSRCRCTLTSCAPPCPR